MSTEEAQSAVELAGQVVDAIYVLAKTVSAYSVTHPQVGKSAHDLTAAIQAAGVPFVLHLVADGVFRDKVLIPLDILRFMRSQKLSEALDNLGVHELAFDGVPAVEDLVHFCHAVAVGAAGPSEALDGRRIAGLRWKEIPFARRGIDMEEVDPDVFAVTQMALAFSEAETVRGHPRDTWPWALGVSIVRRIEHAVSRSPEATARVIETAPGVWTEPRRAVSAAFRVLSVLRMVGTTTSTARAATHAALALGLHSYAPRSGPMSYEAAPSLEERLLASPMTAVTGIEPHRFRVCSLVHYMGHGSFDGKPGPAVVHLIHLAHDLERQRCPEGVGFSLTMADLLARAVQAGSEVYDSRWVHLLVAQAGAVPPGAAVMLQDGSVGVVMGPGEGADPWRPAVLAGGALFTPPAPVRLVPASAFVLSRQGWS